jgi:hypothetical protein
MKAKRRKSEVPPPYFSSFPPFSPPLPAGKKPQDRKSITVRQSAGQPVYR